MLRIVVIGRESRLLPVQRRSTKDIREDNAPLLSDETIFWRGKNYGGRR